MLSHHVGGGSAEAPVLALFDLQVAALAGGYRMVRFDLRGRGSSSGPDGPYTIGGLTGGVFELVGELGIRWFRCAGVSIGGAVGQRLAIDRGYRWVRVTVIASAARFANPGSWRGRAGCCGPIGGFDVGVERGRIGVRCLAIAGGEDPATTPEMVRGIAEAIPVAEFLTIPGGAHLVNAAHPEPVTDALAAHLARAERA
jgi:3-oxoadipate enol-lactonase